MSDSVTDALIDYAAAIRAARRANPAMTGQGAPLELLLAPRFASLIERLLPGLMTAPPQLLPEFRQEKIGRPDLAFTRPGQPARSFIELKRPDTDLNPKRLRGHDKAQFERFRELPFLGFANFHTIHLYRQGELLSQAVLLPASTLDPETADSAAIRLIRRHDARPWLQILETLAIAPPPHIRNARDFATSLARAARLVRRIVADLCAAPSGPPAALDAVRADFRDTLFAHAAAGGYDDDTDELFANAFAQTLAFGLLLAREAGGRDVDTLAYQRLTETTYPLLRATLRALTLDEVLDALGAGFDVIRDAVNSFAPELLAIRAGHDPILYFYEDFLAAFDPKARLRYGVFFTPVEVVRFIVRRTDRALREGLGSGGLLDPAVRLLDPACGTGTFLIAAAEEVAAQAGQLGQGLVAAEILSLSRRLQAFELLVGPYTVAHYRMLREVAQYHVVPLERLPIYLADTLAPPAGALSVSSRLDFLGAPIVAERKAADAVKAGPPILAIFGNPPYRRLKKGEVETLVGPWMNSLWEDLKRPVREAGFGRSLNPFPDLYVAFWRWALWRLFEAEGAERRGVVAFITNRGFLAGRAFGGLRRMLRRRFDAIEIVDLRGDNRGALPAGVAADENVFNIETGVCVLTAWATGRKAPGTDATIRYADAWDAQAFRRADKLALLEAASSGRRALPFRTLPGTGMDRLKPVGFAGRDWPALDLLLRFRSNGIVTYRDDFAYALTRTALEERIKSFLELGPIEAAETFKESASSKVGPALKTEFDAAAIERVAYRPLDQRWLYNRGEFVDRPRWDFQAAWGPGNIALFAPEDGIGFGPATWCHGAKPDQHAFRGSYGGWVFPLYDPAGPTGATFFHPDLLAALAEAYGTPPTAQQTFDTMLALLSATNYTTRFAADLEDDLPHVPFPADPAIFHAAARLGAGIRKVQTFAKPAARCHQRARIEGRATGVTLAVPTIGRAFREAGAGHGYIPLMADASLRLANIPDRVWKFQVSGYPVLYRWLAARSGEALDPLLLRAALDIAARISQLLRLFDAAEPLLDRAVADPLTTSRLALSKIGTAPAESLF